MDPITTLIGVIFGGVSAAAAVGGVYIQLRHISTLKTLRRSLKHRLGSRSFGKKEPTEQLVDMLERAMIIVGPLRAKLLRRFVITLLIIGGIFLGVGGDLPGEVGAARSFEYFDIALLLVQLLAGLVNRTPYFLDSEERDFLSNLAALDSQYYQVFVLPALQDFNEDALSLPWLREARKRESADMARIRRIVKEELGTSEGHEDPKP